ncbi:hypothetical protein VNO77_18828 [Canavalia gladiata]|uniref:Uncharacterized protein n=1 Tax=Canavalia gladiata TaxID=3824 RepID=A0AAN9QKQ7_CANGL
MSMQGPPFAITIVVNGVGLSQSPSLTVVGPRILGAEEATVVSVEFHSLSAATPSLSLIPSIPKNIP